MEAKHISRNDELRKSLAVGRRESERRGEKES